MVFRRMLGGSQDSPQPPAPAPAGPTQSPSAQADTATVRRIVQELESLPPERARYLAGFAYVLGRAANADMVMTDDETAAMERIVMEVGGLPEAQAILVVEIAKQQERLAGGTEDYLVTREWAKTASEGERLALLRCCFLIGAVDNSINSQESAVLNEIANELLLDREEVARIRGEFTDQYAAIQEMRSQSAGR